jgi:HD-GYP domain-containing protein (c-di-GMP phosphodiesterase class II)
MPIAIPVDQLESGMTLASNIVNKYSVLLPHGHALSETDIVALHRRFPNKMVQVIDPLLDDVVEFDDDSQDHKVSLEVRRNIATVSQKVSQVVRSGAALTADNMAGMQKTIEEMMQFLQNNPVAMAVIDQSSNWDEYLQEHSSNVFYLSLVIGNTIRNHIKRERERLSAAKKIRNAMDLTSLATAAMIHDIGMVPIERLYHKTGPLTKNEIDLIRAHPKSGADMLPDKIDPMVKLIVCCHHENQCGSGYPQGLSGDKIAIFARIIRVADAYSAGTSTTIYKKAKSSVLALYEMLYGEYKDFYDPAVLKVFARIIQPFPIGAKLRLESKQIAVVTKHNPKNPFKPQIIIALDKEGKHLPEEKFEGPFFLDERNDVKVISFDEEDISYINGLGEEDLYEDSIEKLMTGQKNNEVFDLAYP